MVDLVLYVIFFDVDCFGSVVWVEVIEFFDCCGGWEFVGVGDDDLVEGCVFGVYVV